MEATCNIFNKIFEFLLKLLKIEITTQKLAKEVWPSFLSYLVIANQKTNCVP